MAARFVSPFVEGEEPAEVFAEVSSTDHHYGSFSDSAPVRKIGSFREVSADGGRGPFGNNVEHEKTPFLSPAAGSGTLQHRSIGVSGAAGKSFSSDHPNDKTCLLKRSDATVASKPVPTANKVISSLIAMLQGVEVLCNLAILYLYKDDFRLDPAIMSVVMGALKVPWTVKPVWAMMSDNLPLFGYRRKSYIFVGAFLCICATVGMGLIGCTNIWLATSLLFLYFVGSATCNVIGEALVVEAGRGDATEEGTAKTVSIFFAFRKVSFAVMSYLSGFLLDYMDKRYVFLLATTLPLAVFISNFFLVEPMTEILPVKEQLRRLGRVIRRPALLHSTLFIFIMMSTPSAGSIMFYFMTNELKFGPELLGRMALFQSIASLLGILTYMWFFTTTSLRKLLFVSTLVVTPFCLLPVIVVQRWNVQIGIPDTAFVVTDTVLMEFVGEFQAMPILVLAARLCPPGLESTIYSFLLSAYNLGLGLGSLLSAGLTAAYGISATNFTNLTSLIIVCAATNLIPVCLIWMVPDNIPAIETAEFFEPFSANPPPRRKMLGSTDSLADPGDDVLEASTNCSTDVEKGVAGMTRRMNINHPNKNRRGSLDSAESTGDNESLHSGPEKLVDGEILVSTTSVTSDEEQSHSLSPQDEAFSSSSPPPSVRDFDGSVSATATMMEAGECAASSLSRRGGSISRK
ncbi:integral membrane protein [Cystoisospora suis]|uniref:Integral membrane protein n=1 Tax=Cystoisospora suis TaxID=483139 RepID=A0A2C6KSR7_9APIC|nr:integral membrane protein [Cystoisospora suis]